MKNAKKRPPHDLVERTFNFAGPLIQEAEEIKLVIGAIIVSSKRGSNA